MEVDPYTDKAKANVAYSAFIIYLLFLSLLDYVIYNMIRENLSVLTSTIIITGIDLVSFTLFYKIIDEFYDKIIFKHVLKIDNLSGTWYQFHLPKDYDLNNYRFGKVEVEQKYYHINMQGENHGLILKVDSEAYLQLNQILKNIYEVLNNIVCNKEALNIESNKMEPGKQVSLSQYMKEANHAINDILELYGKVCAHCAKKYSSDEYCKIIFEIEKYCISSIKDIENNISPSDLYVEIDTVSRFTTWTYLTAYIDVKNSKINAFFKAHSDKPAIKIKTLCPECKDKISSCSYCRDFKTEETKITQQSDKYGGHFINLPQNQVEKTFGIFNHAERIYKLNGEYHNMLPNNSGEGILMFYRSCKEIAEICPIDNIEVMIDEKNIPPEMEGCSPRQIIDQSIMKGNKIKYRSKKDLEDHVKKYIMSNMEFTDAGNVMLGDVNNNESKEDFYKYLAKYVAIHELKKCVADGIRFNISKNSNSTLSECLLYSKNPDIVLKKYS